MYWCPLHPRRHMLYRGFPLPTDASFWSRRVHGLTGCLDEKGYPGVCMDADWFLRMSKHVVRWQCTRRPLSRFVEHGQRATYTKEAGRALGEILLDVRRRGLALYSVGSLRWIAGSVLCAVWDRLYSGRFFASLHPGIYWHYWQCLGRKAGNDKRSGGAE